MNVNVINELAGRNCSQFVRKVLALVTSTWHMLQPVIKAKFVSLWGIRQADIKGNLFVLVLLS